MNKWLRNIHLVLIPQNWDRGRYCFSRAPGARRARCTRRPIVLPLYIECYFGWFIDETLSSLLVRYRLFLLFFMAFLPNASRATLSITDNIYPRCAAFATLASPPLPLSLRTFLTLYRHSEWQALVISSFQLLPRTGPVDCIFRRLAGFKKWEEEGKARRREWERENRRDDKFAKGKRW